MADTSNMAGNSGWSSVAGAAVQGATGLLGSVIAGEYNKKLAERQNEFNLQMWNLQNEYNSPQAQMQRFRDAGLNPNLIYGQGSPGNATSAPQQVVPEPPDIEGTARRIGELFNIENLRTVHANRLKAQADAKMATIAAENARDEREAARDFGELYSFDPNSGQWVFNHRDLTVTRKMKPWQRNLAAYTGALSTQAYRFGKLQENQYKSLHLIPYRAALLDYQKNYLVPQVSMANYEARMFPYSFWIGQGSRALNAIGSVIPKMSFKLGGSRGQYVAPNGRGYYY